ncbi:hypothetical protein [Hyphomicrobium sp.]|uniref:hypothetical protein n=1 Tax=Hyphomicrobium sp. TaxID=82 RepID=UPI002E3476B4|nr:hypothetical protein [Hyphomicrobium sp.]HEX2840870.1 hypothetical protein [Hyphomicrobium sp.]
MPLNRLIDGGSFTPEALKVVYEAFDLAWEEIASRYGDDLARIDFARTTLAQTILSVAGSDPKDPHLLKTTALASFARFNRD